MTQAIYKEVLLDHFKNPRNKGELSDADLLHRGSNPRCGDEIEVGLFLQEDSLQQVRFRGRGCSVCLASSSMMTEVVSGHSVAEVSSLCEKMKRWFSRGSDRGDASIPGLEALSAVRDHPARHKCVMLPWEALSSALDKQSN